MTEVLAGAALSAAGLLTAGADPGLESLWDAYSRAAICAADTWASWRMMRAISATDGTAGFLYGKAYAAQQVADAAHLAYTAAQKAAFPGVRG
jgi:hypothetical protein